MRQVLLDAEAEGRLEPERRSRAFQALEHLQKTVITANRQARKKAVDQFARLFLEVLDGRFIEDEEEGSSDD